MTESRQPNFLHCAVALIGLWLSAAFAAADITRVDIKPAFDATTPESAGPLTLRDIATISGPLESELADIVLTDLSGAVSAGAPSRSITLSEIRRVLDGKGVNWGRIELSGQTCLVALPARASQVSKRDAGEARETRQPETVDISGPPTVRTAIARRIGAMLNVANDDLRLKFEPADDDILAAPTEGLRVDLQPTSNAASGRVPIHVTAYQGDRVVLSRLVSATVLVRRTVAAATGPIDRGERLTSDHIDVSEQWVSPATRPSANPEAIEGSVASVRMQPGQVITDNTVAQPIVCKRGDIIYVHALSGSVSVKAKARAMAVARDGEIVQLKLDGSDRVFTARMDGPGRAVLIVNPEQQQDSAPPTPEAHSTLGTDVADQSGANKQGAASLSPVPPQPPAHPTARKPKTVHPFVKKNPR